MAIPAKAIAVGVCASGLCKIETEQELYVRYGNMFLCRKCAESVDVLPQYAHTLEVNRMIDTSISLKQEIFNSAAISIKELRAAIDQNDEIEQKNKDIAFTTILDTRVKALSKAIFDINEIKVWMENEKEAATRARQDSIAHLKGEQREKFRSVDVRYQPEPATRTNVRKAADTSGPRKWRNDARGQAEVNAMAKKYSIDASILQMSMVARPNMPVEFVARRLAKLPVETE